jgi:hypothetical protein
LMLTKLCFFIIFSPFWCSFLFDYRTKHFAISHTASYSPTRASLYYSSILW